LIPAYIFRSCRHNIT